MRAASKLDRSVEERTSDKPVLHMSDNPVPDNLGMTEVDNNFDTD